MKFLCIRCDEPMKMASAEPPDGSGSILAIFGCPSCEHQVAMLTNAHETQMVQSLGVKIGPAEAAEAGEAAEGGGCPFSGMVAEASRPDAGPRWTDGALERLDRIPEFVRPMAKQGIEQYARSEGHGTIDESLLEEARSRFDM